jgi:hypothetical protein
MSHFSLRMRSFQEILLMEPHPNVFAPEIEIKRRQINGNIYRSNSHEKDQWAISSKPIIDDPCPDPSNQRFHRRDCYHQLHRELGVAVQRVVHAQGGAHLATDANNTPSDDWSCPVCLVLEAQPCDQSTNEYQCCGNDAGWQTHLGLTDAMVAARVKVRDAVGYWPAEVGSHEGANEGGEEYETLL